MRGRNETAPAGSRPTPWNQRMSVSSATTTHDRQVVEAFVYGPDASLLWLDKGSAEARPVLDRLIGKGVSLILPPCS